MLGHEDWISLQIAGEPGITLKDLALRLLEQRDQAYCVSSMWYFLDTRGYRFKKSFRAIEQDRPDIAAARSVWTASQPTLEPGRLVFNDDTGAATNTVRCCGRCVGGARLKAPQPHGQWK